MRTAPALAAAIAVPFLLGLAWLPRDAPPTPSCAGFDPPGQAAAVAEYRVGLGPAVIVAVVLLVALGTRLSADRRRGGVLPPRPGGPTVSAGALAVVAAIRSAFEVEMLADAAFVTVLAIPVHVVLILLAIAWIVWQPPGLKGLATAQAAVWAALLLTLVVAGFIAATGMPGWCFD